MSQSIPAESTPRKPLICQGSLSFQTYYSLRTFSDWGWGVKPLLVPAAPVGRSLLSAVGALAAASRGPEGGRPNLCRDLGGVRPPARSSQWDRLARRPHGNDTAPPVVGRKLDLPQAADAASSLPQRNSASSAHMRCRTLACWTTWQTSERLSGAWRHFVARIGPGGARALTGVAGRPLSRF